MDGCASREGGHVACERGGGRRFRDGCDCGSRIIRELFAPQFFPLYILHLWSKGVFRLFGSLEPFSVRAGARALIVLEMNVEIMKSRPIFRGCKTYS